MNKIFAFGAITVLILASVSVYTWPWSGDEEKKVVRIGVLVPLSGTLAPFGEDIRNALTLALEDLEERNALSVELVYEDSAGDPKIAVPAAIKLIELDKVSAIIGAPGSTANVAVAPLAEEHNVPFLPLSATLKLNEAGNYVFKAHHDVDFEIMKMASHISEQGHQRAAVMYDSTSDSQTAAAELFTDEFAKHGGTVTRSDGYDGKNTTDFRSMLTNMRGSQPDAYYLLGVEKLTGLMLRQAQEIGIQEPRFGWTASNGDELFVGAGAAAEGFVITDVPFTCVAGTQEMLKYCAEYEARFGRTPQNYGATAYDLIKIVHEALSKEDDLSHGAIVRAIQVAFTNRSYYGLSGDLHFDAAGNIREKDFILRKVSSGKFMDI